MSTEQQIAEASMNNPSIPKIYVNGFVAGFTGSDVFVVLQSGVAAVAILQMSFNVAKTLGVSMNQTITEFEGKMGQEVLTIQDIRNRMEGAEKEPK